MFNRLITILICSIILSACGKKVFLFSSFKEPATEGLRFLYSYDGVKWIRIDTTFLEPVLDQKVIRDPSISKGPDGRFHLVFTSAWKGKNGFGYANSKDLIHWSEQKMLDVMKQEPATVNVWAPELFYDEEQKQFIIIWASTIPHRFPRGTEEEENNHRMYYTTTRDFKTFSDTQLFFDPGFSVIDCVIVKKGINDYVLVLKDNTRPNRNIKVAFANNPLGPYSTPSAPFSPNFTEGPAVVRVGNEFMIYYDQYKDKIYGAMKTRDFKTFTDFTKEVTVPIDHKHGTVFSTNRKVLKRLLAVTKK